MCSCTKQHRLEHLNVVVVQSLSCDQLLVTPWTAGHQASLSFTISWSLLKLMSIASVMPSNHLILCHPLSSCLQSFPVSGSLNIVDFISCQFENQAQTTTIPTPLSTKESMGPRQGLKAAPETEFSTHEN